MGKSNYEISVIIPSHNTDPKFFKHCIDSVKNQDFGFDNIELIVVFHNCDDEREKELRSIVGEYDNVIMETLKNDIHSPSCPRNRGLDLATGDYIGFLDADDKYTPQCIEKALGYIKETDSDVIHFRRMVELEKPAAVVMNEIVLWDQTRETIVIDMGKTEWNPDEYYVAQWSMVTHKIYRRSFIEEHHIRFSDDIVIAEDSEFSANVYGKAKRICLAPQLIGYVYYVNSQSIVQSAKLDEKVLVEYAESFKKLFDSIEENGIDPSESVAGLTLLLSSYIFALKDVMTPEARKKIKDILEPYIRNTKQIPPSKLYPPGRIERMNTLPKLLILGEPAHEKHFFVSNDERPPETFSGYQGRILQKILEENYDTDFGKRYGFKNIFSLEDYRDALDVTDYDVYHPMFELTSKIGEKGIFTWKPITAHALSYGNLGVLKEVPITDGAVNRYVDEFDKLIGETRYFPMFESLPYQESIHAFVNVYTNTLYPLIQNAFIEKTLKKRGDRASMVTPAEIMFPTELNSFEYVRLVFALADKSVETIFAPNAWVLYSGIRRIIKDHEKICDDIRTGTLSETLDISDELLSKISWRLSSLPERANELMKLFEQGDFSLKKIWPRLETVIADGTGSFVIYKKKAMKYLEGISYNNGLLADELCLYGTAVPGEDLYKLDPTSAYYEYMKEDGTTVLSFDLKEQEKYRIIVSTHNGLFRYKSDMFIRPVKISDEKVIVEKCCPINFDQEALNGLIEEDVYDVVLNCEDKYGVSFADFSFLKDVVEDEYLLVMESETEEDYNKATALDVNEVVGYVKELLKDKVNDTSKNLRVVFNEVESGFMYRDREMFRKNILPDAVYPPHIRETFNSKKNFGKI